jgi:predicted nucleic acid-binding protein
MYRIARRSHALIDTSAVVAMLDPSDKYHRAATEFFALNGHLVWHSLNATSHETFTRVRYDFDLPRALERYGFLRTQPFRLLPFDEHDEQAAEGLLRKYDDQVISYHDALCAAVMHRHGILRIFAFDAHFWALGFEMLPGVT